MTLHNYGAKIAGGRFAKNPNAVVFFKSNKKGVHIYKIVYTGILSKRQIMWEIVSNFVACLENLNFIATSILMLILMRIL